MSVRSQQVIVYGVYKCVVYTVEKDSTLTVEKGGKSSEQRERKHTTENTSADHTFAQGSIVVDASQGRRTRACR